MNKGAFAGQRNVPFLPFEPAGGHVIPAQPLLPIPDFARVVAVTRGSGAIRRLPAWAAYSEAVILIFKAAVTLVHSAYLVLPDEQNITTEVDDMALAVPIGDGRWSLKYGFKAQKGTWKEYTPEILVPGEEFGLGSPITTPGVHTGRYKIVEKVCHLHGTINIDVNGANTGMLRVSIPTYCDTGAVFTVSRWITDPGDPNYPGYVGGFGHVPEFAGNYQMVMAKADGGYIGGDNTRINFSGTYEVAGNF